jgi:hypothetical protein
MERKRDPHRLNVVNLGFLDFENMDGFEIKRSLAAHVAIDKLTIGVEDLENLLFQKTSEGCDETGSNAIHCKLLF